VSACVLVFSWELLGTWQGFEFCELIFLTDSFKVPFVVLILGNLQLQIPDEDEDDAENV